MVELYAALINPDKEWKTWYTIGHSKLLKAGISHTHLMSVISNDRIHIRIRDAYVKLAWVMFVDVEPFKSIAEHSLNRIYNWKLLDQVNIDETIIKWENDKLYSLSVIPAEAE